MTRSRTASLSETLLQQHVVKLLNSYARPDVCWWAVPNGSLRNWKVGTQLKAEGVRAGAPDLCFLIDGKFHALELKTEIGVLSGKQLQFHDEIERAGGLVHIAFGLDQALGVLAAIGALRPGIQLTSALGKGRATGEGAACSPLPNQGGQQ